ncbi:MAG: hypothetical protein NTX03_03990 [Bacteroidetes bacterium]|nr:hypothetical protein [Bacteroidota bacterium]
MKYLFYLVSFLVISSCKHPTKYGFIIAGDKSSDGIKASKLLNAAGDVTEMNRETSFSIDIDNDWNDDIVFSDHHMGGISHSYITYSLSAANKTEQIFVDTNSIGCIKKHNYGDTINDGLKFRNVGAKTNYLYNYGWRVLTTSYSYGEWENATNKYLAFKLIKKNGTIYYGWIRMDVTSTIIVKDYAYRQ